MSEKAQHLYTPQEDLETAPPAYEPPSEDLSNPSSSRAIDDSPAPASTTDSKTAPTRSIPNPYPDRSYANPSYNDPSYSNPSYPNPYPYDNTHANPYPYANPNANPYPNVNANPNPYPNTYPYGNTNTKKPIAIPAIDPYSSHSPFLRAFPPILRQSHNFPRESFLPFLDNLNKVIAESPPLEVLDVTGGILQSVPILFPLHWIGAAVSGLAQRGNSGVSKSRTDSLIRQANKEMFGPRNLRIEIARLDALAHIAQVPILSASGSGRIDNAAPVMQRLVAADAVNATDASNQTTSGGIPEGIMLEAVQQQIAILQPWIADLEFDPLPRTAKSKLTRFNAALRRYNDPQDERRERGKYPEEREEGGMRKGLWLVIRELD